MELLEGLLHKDEIYSFGNNYPDKIFYVIRREDIHAGIGSFLITNLGYISYAKRKKYIPIIDMKTNKNIYNNNSNINSWELFFQQPCGYSLNDIEKAKNVVFSPTFPCRFRPNDSMFFYNNTFGYLLYWKKITNSFIFLKNDLHNSAIKFWEEISKKNNKILGIFIRGTDYIKMKPSGHPIQPSVEQIIKKIDEINSKQKFDLYFLVTEDKLIYEKLNKEYGSKLLIYNNSFINYNGNEYLANSINVNEAQMHGENYIKSLLILSKCQYIVSSRASGSVVAMLFKEKIKNKYIFDLGEYK